MRYSGKKGTVLKERYRLEGVFGRGGMSSVFLAQDLKQGGYAAVKEDRNGEARILSGLCHPGIVRYRDSFLQYGRSWLVEEYVEGMTLSDYVKRKGPVPEAEGFFLGLQLSSVLQYLQGQRPPVVYRDLKPENIMLTRKGRVCLIDFGIAREYVPGEDADTSGFGTVGYAAPEQYEGSRMQSDVRSDLFALGKVLYFLLTGDDPKRIPPEEWKKAVCLRIKNPAAAELILQCTERDPENRPSGAEVVSYELRRLCRPEKGKKSRPLRTG